MTEELDINDYSQPLGPGQKTFDIDWLYPAFHFVLPQGRKKPPLSAPIALPWPKNVIRPSKRNEFVLGPDNGCTFHAFKCRVRSRTNHNRLLVVWVFAPTQAIAMRYLKDEMNVIHKP